MAHALYRDVVEINPPLIVALNVPVVWAAREFGVSEFLLYRLILALAIAALLLFTRRLLTRYVVLDAASRRFILLVSVFVLFPLAAEDFGEREHLVLALLWPYAALAAARVRGSEPTRGEAMAVGLLGGLALALKPHFGLAWLALELYVRLRRADLRTRLTPELGLVAVTLLTYAGIVLTLTPEYLGLAAQLGPAYMTYLRDPFYRLLITGPGVALVLLALLAAFASRHAADSGGGWGVLAALTVGFLLAGAAQEKGLRYHFYPAFGSAFALLAVVAAQTSGRDRGRDRGALSERLYATTARLVAAAIVIVVLGRTAVEAAGGGPAERRARAQFLTLAELVRERAQGEPVGVLSYHIESAFPLVSYAGVPLASRFPHLWLFPVSYWHELHQEAPLAYRRPETMGPRERYLFESVREDLTSARPRVLLVLRPARDVPRNGLRRLHYIQYFSRDPALAALFSEYQLVGSYGEHDVYERVGAGARHAAPPDAAPGTADARLARVTEFQLGLFDAEFVAGLVTLLVLAAWSGLRARRRRTVTPATGV